MIASTLLDQPKSKTTVDQELANIADLIDRLGGVIDGVRDGCANSSAVLGLLVLSRYYLVRYRGGLKERRAVLPRKKHVIGRKGKSLGGNIYLLADVRLRSGIG